MADFITPFDPTATSAGQFNVSLPNGGWLFIHNESTVELQILAASKLLPVLVPAYTARCFRVPTETRLIKWASVGQVQSPGQAPISQVYGEAYAPDEWGGGEMYVALSRQVNIGNASTATTAASIVNDGHASGTSVIEATETGSPGSNVSLDNQGNLTLAEVDLGNVLNKILQVIAGVGVGGDAIILNQNKANWVHILSQLKVDRLSSLDGGAITTDGAGNVAAASLAATGNVQGVSLVAAPQAVGGGTPTLLDLKPAGATVTKHWVILYNGVTGGIQFYNLTDGINAFTVTPAGGLAAAQSMSVAAVLSVTGSSSLDNGKLTTDGNGDLTKIGNQAAAAYGVPIVRASATDTAVTSTATTTICSLTTPNDAKNHLVRVNGYCYVGSGNTNNGAISFYANLPSGDPNSGAVFHYFQTNTNALLNNATISKGTAQPVNSFVREVGPNQTASIVYTNAAAGTIADKVSGVIELLN